MHVITALNIEDAWSQAKQHLLSNGYNMASRNGDVRMNPMPVATTYWNPAHRVLNDPVRDANPFFHLMEALWMLAGRNDVAWIKQFNQRMGQYSDDGVTLHGAYGHRWRYHFDLYGGAEDEFSDQLKKAIACLRADPYSRRVVVQMWDPRADLWSPEDVALRGSVPKDLPCNTAVYFDCRQGALNMTVTNRSNDIVWGCYGANVVHMSILQEYVASMCGVPLGWYCQVSNNWHAYLDVWNRQDFSTPWIKYCGHVEPLVANPLTFDDDLRRFMDFPALDHLGREVSSEQPSKSVAQFDNSFFRRVAVPMMQAYFAHKNKDSFTTHAWLNLMPTRCDWRVAATDWMQRRQERKA